MAEVTKEMVEGAYRALATGSRDEIVRYYDENVRWLVPGNHALAGWYENLDGFLDLMSAAGKLTGGSFAMTRLTVLTGEDCSADLCRNTGLRQGAPADAVSPYDRLDTYVFHFMRWRDGRIVEGRDGLFGDDATAFTQFWSPLRGSGSRYLEEDA